METDRLPIVKKSFYTRYGKRLLDILLSGLALIVLSPVLLVVCIFAKIYHGHPIFYTTTRPGKKAKPFTVTKFRSMTNETDDKGVLLPEDKRITRFGRFLRRTSLDELPQLFSILNGDMSVIGPRPLLTEYLCLYSDRHKMRHAVRPGLACVRLSMKTQKDALGTWTWNDQFENDIFYVENCSLFLDIRMIFAVAREAINGSSTRTDDTRVRFNGQNLTETRSKQEVAQMQNCAERAVDHSVK